MSTDSPTHTARASGSILRRALDSTVITTWASFGARILSQVAVLPFILKLYTTEEISLWYVFIHISGLVMLLDLGIAPTCTRLIAFASGGGKAAGDYRTVQQQENTDTCWAEVARVCAVMRLIYSYLAVGVFLFLAIGGTFCLSRSIASIPSPIQGWVAWCLTLVAAFVRISGNTYRAYLEGLNHVALVRRWEALVFLCALVTSLVAAWITVPIAGLIAISQFWLVAGVLWNRWLCGRVEGGKYLSFSRDHDRRLLTRVWSLAWRNGTGMLAQVGTFRLSALFYSRFTDAATTASYLMALQFAQTIVQMSQAPFYSKLPLLARLRATGDTIGQTRIAQKGMGASHLTYVLALIAVGTLAPPALKLVGSNAEFVTPVIWASLGCAFFVERFTAMHLQFYSTTNHIVTHKANGVTGIVYVLLILVYLPRYGAIAFPLSLLAANLVFSAWYTAIHSHRSMGRSFLSFECRTSLAQLALLLAYTAIVLSRSWTGT
jgi:hypothetical protein